MLFVSLALSLLRAAPSLGGAEGRATARVQLPAAFFIRTWVRRPAGQPAPAAAKVLFNYRDAKNHYALVLSPKAARLVKVAGGAETVLAGPTAVAVPEKEPLPILVKRLRSRIDCFVGRDTLLTARDGALSGGRAARVAAEDGLALERLRVQRIGPIRFSDDFMRAKTDPDAWARLAGPWELDEVPNATWSANAFRYIGRGKGACLAATGNWFWHDYALTAAVRPGDGCGAAGVAFYVRDAGNYLAFRWVAPKRPGAEGAVELVRVRAGKETVAARAEGLLDPTQWCELGVAVQRDRVVAFVDRRRVLTAVLPGLTCGKAGLYCRDAAGVRFDDVAVESVRLPQPNAALDATVLPKRRERIAERFHTDSYMQQWASELGSWMPEGREPGRYARAYWHIGFFPGDFALTWRAEEPLPFEQGPLEIAVAPESRDTAKGYTFGLSRDQATGRIDVRLSRIGKQVASGHVVVPPGEPVKSLAIRRAGARLSVALAGREALSWRDAQPLAVRRIRAECRWVHRRTLHHYSTTSRGSRTVRQPAVRDLEAVCPELRDYAFHRAPADWVADTGTWELTSRWFCLPLFTWLGGWSHEAAVLWNKRQYSGDLIVDVHAAMLMNYGPMSGYDHYGDLNVTLCADGKDLSTGYAAMYGGAGNSASRILRRDKVVAENTSVLYPSRGQGSHNRWYHVRLEKRGSRVLLFINNQLAADYTDPKPLSGKRIAIWTWNRGIMVARVRIWAERDQGVTATFGKGRPPAPKPPPSPRRARSPIRIASASHPSVQQSFDAGVEGWHCPTGEHGGRLRWEPRGRGGCLCVENAESGGDFAAYFPVGRFDARRLQRLLFDYRLDPQVKINLYLRVRGDWHVVGLTGPTAPAFHAVTESRDISGRAMATAGTQLEAKPPIVLGRLEAVADGKWHHAALDLFSLLRAAYPEAERLVVEDLHFGNWSNQGYLQCGFGGNPRGARYWLDNVFLGSHGGAAGQVTWSVEGATGFAAVVDQSPAAMPDPRKATASRSTSFKGLASGRWYVHVGRIGAKGTWGRVSHHRLLVDTQAPTVRHVAPAAGVRLAPTAITVLVADPGGSGLDPSSLRLVVAGRAVAPERVSVSDDGTLSTVTADLRGFAFRHEQQVACELSAADRAGNRMAQPFRWTWTFDRSQDKTPPTTPVLTTPAPSDWGTDFEAPSDEWQRFPGSAWSELVLDSSTAASGKRCLRVEGGPGPFRCYLRQRAFDVRARPILSFDYKADAAARWDLAFLTDKGWHVGTVSGGTRQWPVIGKFTTYVADGTWRRADWPLGSLLAQTKSCDAPVVEAIALVAPNLSGGQTSVVRLDNMRLAPAVFAADELTLGWASHDVSGIEGYSVALDTSPTTEPDTTIDWPRGEGKFKSPPAGKVYFHCRARDAAGNWGQTLHQLLVVEKAADAAPPEVAALWPKPGSRTATDTLRIAIHDKGTGVSAETLRLTVNGRTYSLGSPELRLLPAQNAVEWTAPQRGKLGAPPFADGTQVKGVLTAADYAGNPLPKPAAWTWTMDFKQDKTPPAAVFVTWRPTGALLVQDFERGPGQWMGRREGWAAVTDETAATGRRCIRFGGFSTFMQYAQYDAGRFPIVGFDYRLDPGAQVNLMARSENRNLEIRFTAKGAKYPIIGLVPGVVDGQWHSCRFNLADMLRAAPERFRSKSLIVDHLATLARSRPVFHADNFYIAPANAKGVDIEWSVPRDPTGIKGYSVALDHSPTTVPDTKVNATEPKKTYSKLKPGTWHFHVRACDGAGNWSGATHARLSIAE